MKNFFKKIIAWYKDDFITFNIFLAVIITGSLFLIFRKTGDTNLNTFIIVSLWILLIIGINYIIEKISKKYIVEIPNEKDCECDSYILKTKDGEIFKMNEKWIWSEKGKLYKIKSNAPNKKGKWIRSKEENTYLFSITIGEINFEECREELFINFFLEDDFNPIEIYKIYQENDIKIVDNCLYIEDALKATIIKINQNNGKLKNTGLHCNDNFIESFKQNLLIPKLSGVKNYAIYRKECYQ